MAIALTITRPGYVSEIIPLGSYRMHKEGWAPIAAGLGLELIPLFYSFLPVGEDYLDRLIEELVVFRCELVRLGESHEGYIEYVDRLSDALRKLKVLDGWRAAIG